jgi:hypothetical protein
MCAGHTENQGIDTQGGTRNTIFNTSGENQDVHGS